MSLLLHAFISGSGCPFAKNVIYDLMDSRVSDYQLIEKVKPFLPDKETADDFMQVRECFLNLSEENQENVIKLQVI